MEGAGLLGVVGAVVGTLVGAALVGAAEDGGCFVGIDVGTFVGALEGAVVGDAVVVGLLEVGAVVGALEGAPVRFRVILNAGSDVSRESEFKVIPWRASFSGSLAYSTIESDILPFSILSSRFVNVASACSCRSVINKPHSSPPLHSPDNFISISTSKEEPDTS